MTRARWWIAGAVLLGAVIAALGWFLGIDPALAAARVADEERASVEEVNLSYEAALVRLKKLDEDLPAMATQLAELEAALPKDAQISTLLGQLNELADRSSVQLTAITAGTPAAFEAAVPAVPDVPAVEGEAPAETPAEPAPAEAAPVVDPAIANLVAVPITVGATGTPDAILAFIDRVQYGTRLFVVTGLKLEIDAGGGKTTIEGLVYVLLDEAAVAAEADAAATDSQATG